MKRLVLIVMCCVAAAICIPRTVDAEPTLGIGSKAPALDIEFYFEEDDPRVTKFDAGSVYVVEFWATWCGPCIQSMPHLADLQNEFRNSGVQIVSVSDESVDEVEATLKKAYPGKIASFAEVTSPYILTTDPDRSVYQDYMVAAEQNGIPTSFIVGKSGLIEWIGHPMDLDDPLKAVVEDAWDREAFKAEMEEQQRFDSTLQEFAQLAGTGKYDQAAQMLEDQIANTKSDELKSRWVMIRHQFNLMSGRAKEADFQFYRDQMKEQKGIPQAVHQTAVMLYSVHQNGGKIGPLAGEAITALQAELKDLEIPEGQAALYSTMARLYTVEEKLDEAIAAQEKAVAAASGLPRSEQQRQKLLLEDLKSQAEKASKKK
ncbi:MAG: TlpA disulfide reductase family protein [Planctomycetota bacterium]